MTNFEFFFTRKQYIIKNKKQQKQIITENRKIKTEKIETTKKCFFLNSEEN